MKLTEHSWWFNSYVNAIAEKIYNNPTNVVWVGDYAEDQFERYDEVWTKENNLESLNESSFLLDNKFLINHDLKTYIDCNEYYKTNAEDGWCLHPLSLLTAIGNGLGLGDYNGIHCQDVGIWADNLLEIADTPPENYTKDYFEFSKKLNF
jgi:hypothetical protein